MFGLGLGSSFWSRPPARRQVFGLGLGLKHLVSFNISAEVVFYSASFLRLCLDYRQLRYGNLVKSRHPNM